MKIYNRFKNIFDIFISKEESNKLLDLLHLMYTKKIYVLPYVTVLYPCYTDCLAGKFVFRQTSYRVSLSGR